MRGNKYLADPLRLLQHAHRLGIDCLAATGDPDFIAVHPCRDHELLEAPAVILGVALPYVLVHTLGVPERIGEVNAVGHMHLADKLGEGGPGQTGEVLAFL